MSRINVGLAVWCVGVGLYDFGVALSKVVESSDASDFVPMGFWGVGMFALAAFNAAAAVGKRP